MDRLTQPPSVCLLKCRHGKICAIFAMRHLQGNPRRSAPVYAQREAELSQLSMVMDKTTRLFLPQLLAAIEKGGERIGLAAGQRVGRKDTGFKKFQSRVANGIRNAILRDGTRDTGCGLKAFRREVFLALPYFDGLHRFLPALVRREGFDVAYVDVIDRPRHSGVSNYGFFDRLWIGIMDLAGVWWLIRRKKRRRWQRR